MLQNCNFCNSIKIFFVNTFKIVIDIPFYIYLFISVILTSCWHKLTRSRKNLDNETILVTGAASGLGKLVVLKLAKISNKAVFILWDINAAGLAETAEKCRELGALNVHTFLVDLCNHEEVVRTAYLVRTHVGRVTILFNNAGFSPYKLFLDSNHDTEEKVIRINLLSQMWTIREFLPDMIEHRSGHIVSTSSGTAFYRYPYLTSYVASKYGLRGFMQSLKAEIDMLPEKPSIKFSTIYPGWVKTDMIGGITWEPRYDLKVLSQMDPEYVSKRMVDGILKEEEEIIIPNSIKHLLLVNGYLPTNLMTRLEHHLFRNTRVVTTNDTFTV